MPALEKILLLFPIDAGGNMTERVCVGIDETMARRNITRRPDSHQAERRAAGMGFVDTLAQLREGIAHVREAVHLAAQCIFEILVGQHVKLVASAGLNPKVTVPSDLPYISLLLNGKV